MSKKGRKYLKKKKEAQMEANFFKYAIITAVVLVVLVIIWNNIGN